MAENKMSHEAVGALPVAAAGALSVSELRAGMQQFLRSSGALGSLKTQLRGVIIGELLRRKAVASPDNQNPVMGMDANSMKNKKREDVEHTRVGRVIHKQKDNATGAAVGEYDNRGSDGDDDDDDNDASWTQRLCDALVEDHLRHTSRTFSLAIFSSEADVSLGSAGDDGLAALLQFPTSHSSSHSSSSSRLSLLQRLVTDHLRRAGDARGHPPRYAIGTQTDSADDGLSPPPMEQRLAAVDAKYALCFSRLGHSTREELERRMSAYRHDVHTQLEQSYQQRLRAFEEQRLREVRAEAEAQSAALLRHKLEEAREASRAASDRIKAEQERLRMAREDIAIARAELERRERDMQRALDERDAATASMESRLDEARQQARLYKAQLQQCEELCAARLMELDAGRAREWRRGEDIRRAQAEHLAEIQLKDEEITRLRFRVRSLTTAAAASATATAGVGVGGSGSNGGNVGSIEEAAMKAYDVQRRLQQLHEQQTLPHHEVYYPYTQPLSTFTQAPPPLPPQPQAEGPVKMEAAWQAAWQREVVGMRSSEAAQEQRICETQSSQPQRSTEEPHEGTSLYASGHVGAQAPHVLGTSPQALPTQEKKYPRKDSSKDSSAKSNSHSNLRHSNSPHEEEQNHSVDDHHPNHQGNTSDRSDKTDGEKKSRESSASRSVVVVPLEEGPSPEHSGTSQRFSSATKSSPSSPSSSSSPSLPSSPPRPSVVEVVELMGSATADESAARELIYGAEDVARRGIVWAAQSQRTVITAREEERQAAEEKAHHNPVDNRVSAAMDAYTAAAQRPQFGAFIARDSDEESDDILFAKRNGSSDESF